MVKKLVMSTSVLIGRRPIDVSRSCSHCGLGPLRRLRMVRPRIQGQASGQSICQRGPPRNAGAIFARLPRLQRADAGGGKIARDAAHREAVAAVRRDADIDHRIVEAGPSRVRHADRCILRQIEDAGVVVAKTHLALGQQHAGAAHAADLADLQRDAGAGNERAGRGEHALHAGARIRRAADHAHRVAAGIDRAHAQPVGVRVLHRLDHARDAERSQRGAAVLDVLQFQADAGQRVGDLRPASRRSRDASSARRG